jgi:hypothetical protein
MFQFYLGKKSRHIPLSNSGILEASVTTKINQPLVLELLIDLAFFEKNGNYDLINYFLDYNSEFYLEILGIRGHLFSKKHNQHKYFALISVDNQENYVVPSGNEILNNGFSFSNKTFKTKNGLGYYIQNDNVKDDNLVEYIFSDNVTNSQELVERLRKEEVSISGQTLSNNILKLTLYSNLHNWNNLFANYEFGKTYQTTKQDLLNVLLNSNSSNGNLANQNLTYTIKNKPLLDIFDDILGNQVLQDKGYNASTSTQFYNTYTPTDFAPLHRLVSGFTHSRSNPIILSIKENYPSISAEILNYNKYIVEGELAMLEYNTKTKNYRGNFIVEGQTLDLLHRYNTKSNTVTLLKSTREVRDNYFEKNLNTISKKYI